MLCRRRLHILSVFLETQLGGIPRWQVVHVTAKLAQLVLTPHQDPSPHADSSTAARARLFQTSILSPSRSKGCSKCLGACGTGLVFPCWQRSGLASFLPQRAGPTAAAMALRGHRRQVRETKLLSFMLQIVRTPPSESLVTYLGLVASKAKGGGRRRSLNMCM